MTYRSIFAPERSAAECLWLWPTVLHRAAPGQDHDFADRIDHQAARKGWEPSPMQLALMRRMVDHYVPDGIRVDPELIDMAEAVTGGQSDDPPPQPCEKCNADGATLHVASGRMLCATCATGNRGRV
ncbi:hypothetical protein [Paracoccus sp. (in: a-proteobacteria)]|uniref:hypothetical protein n=1 Tax=Paracoccus sp. TaxID=267 RepID=UPI002AFF4ABE|nr:hypothetical protein [Paracoccus sp. (in: a-proteobacteria)]